MMFFRRKYLLYFLLFSMIALCKCAYADAENMPLATEIHTHSFTSLKEAKRFKKLIQEIRCLVCQNQNIADSDAPLANDLREKIYQMITAKKSNQEIKNYLVKRYGEFILLQPQFNKLTLLLWIFPFIGLAGIFPFLLHFRSRHA